VQIVKVLIDFILHIDKNLLQIVGQYGTLTYAFVAGIVFMETGFVVTPFLPGDSLLFAGGALAATHALNIFILFVTLIVAAFLGDTVNYWVGRFIGPKVFDHDHKLLKREYLNKAQKFYDKHGGKAIVLARFVPIVRTFAPFVAGVGQMSYPHFLMYNLLGGTMWVSLFLFTGYFFGNLPFIQKNFHYAVFGIIIVSLVPIMYEWLHAKSHKTAKEE
jgi:membrane-associated protein